MAFSESADEFPIEIGHAGEFNRLLQHILTGGVDEAEEVEVGSIAEAQAAVAWQAAAADRAKRWPFWKAIAQGHTSEDAAAIAGVSPAVGNR